MNDGIVIDGQKLRDWRKDMDESYVYIALVEDDFSENIRCIEQTLYAKAKKIPTIILILEGTELSIPDLFEGCNVVAKFIFNENNKFEIKRKFMNKVRELQEGHRIRLHRLSREP